MANRSNFKFYFIILFAVVLIIFFTVLPKVRENANRITSPTVNDFEECTSAGYPIMESYPRQCRTPDGRNFTEVVADVGNDQILGGDKDEHGCIGSAGYTWCNPKQKCLRTWEEACTDTTFSKTDEEKLKTEVKKEIVAKHGPDAESLNISISRVEGNYAQGGAREEGVGGGMWFAAKVEGEWMLVWDGNGTISCSSLDEFSDFPETMIPDCYDELSGEMRIR